MLSIPDMLCIDIAQINYSLYGAVKKLIEINNNKELRLKKLESILDIECDSSNVAIIEGGTSSNVVIKQKTYYLFSLKNHLIMYLPLSLNKQCVPHGI